MAITFIKEPEGIYPAYNDSYIQFTSDLAGHNRAEITVFPTNIFTRNFVIYPDGEGNYLFNLKEPVKAIFNADGFEDANFFTDSYWKSVTDIYLQQGIQIKVYNDTTNDSLSKSYEFVKAVKQVGEDAFDNDFRLLTYTPNGFDHELTYFEGFPFHFEIQRVVYSADKYFRVKSLNTGAESQKMFVTSTGAFRINVDRGGGVNWVTDSVVPLINGLNRLEVYENNVFKVNLNLVKKKPCSGIYLKWFNRNGGYSHYLFDEFYVQNIKGRDAGIVSNTEFQNISEITGAIKSTGKDATRSYVVKAKYKQNEYEVLRDIFISPFVQIYTSTTPNVQGRFVDVIVNGSFSHNNKKAMNEIVITIDLPDMITAKY